MRKLFLSIIALMFSIGLWAQETTQTVSYLYPVYNTTDDPTSGIKEWQTGVVEATVVEASSSSVSWGQYGKSTWYVVTGNVTLSEGAICAGDVHLILADGAKLTTKGLNNKDLVMCGAGINIPRDVGCSFSVYGQTNQSGQLEATGSGYTAGIGGNYQENGSNITINGGVITARSGDFCAGIGGGGHVEGITSDGYGSNITINGGTVTAFGGENGAGIGGGWGGSASNITINGGIVTANGGVRGAGIGGGYLGTSSNITINGGKVTANGGNIEDLYGAGIGGGYKGSSSNIKVSADCKVFADGNNPPTTEIAHDSDTDLASALRAPYAFIEIDQTILSELRAEAIAAIDKAVDGVANDEILAIAREAKNKIMNANNRMSITGIKDAALAELGIAVRLYNSILGPLGEEHPGPAVKVTKGNTEVILYAPDKVEYIIRK